MTISLESIAVFVLLTPFAIIAIGGYLYYLALQLFHKIKITIRENRTKKVEVKANGI